MPSHQRAVRWQAFRRRITIGQQHQAVRDYMNSPKSIDPGTKSNLSTQAGEFEILKQQLQQAEAEATAWRQRYHDLFKSMQEGFALHEIICDQDGKPYDCRFLEVNEAFEKLTGLTADAIIGHTALEVMPGIEPSWIEAFGRVALSGRPERIENYATPLGRYYEVYAFSPRRGQFANLVIDVTDRRNVEAALREANDRFADLTENVPGMIYQTKGPVDGTNSTVPYISSRVMDLTGHSPQAVMADPKLLLGCIHYDDWGRYLEAAMKSMTTLEPFELEFRLVSTSGNVRWVRASSRPKITPDGEILYNGIALDITDLKRAESELEQARAELEEKVQHRTAELVEANRSLQTEISQREETQQQLLAKERLLHRMLDLHERERQLLAYEIHDGFVQDVVGAKMHLEGFRHQVETKCEENLEQFNFILNLMGTAVNEGRRMIGELRPLIIDEQGVIQAIEFLIQAQQLQHGLTVNFEHPPVVPRMSSLLEGSVFRIVQEALTNVRRHSGATKAAVQLKAQDGQLLLEISDKGVGFDPDQVPEQRFGLKGIAERARLFGGTATIDSKPGQGTRIQVTVPMIPADE